MPSRASLYGHARSWSGGACIALFLGMVGCTTREQVVRVRIDPASGEVPIIQIGKLKRVLQLSVWSATRGEIIWEVKRIERPRHRQKNDLKFLLGDVPHGFEQIAPATSIVQSMRVSTGDTLVISVWCHSSGFLSEARKSVVVAYRVENGRWYRCPVLPEYLHEVSDYRRGRRSKRTVFDAELHPDRLHSAASVASNEDTVAHGATVFRPMNGHVWKSPATGMEFLWIPQLRFWVGKYEVTNAEYRKRESEHHSGRFGDYSLNGDRQPVVAISFNDAKAYAEWLTDQDLTVLEGGRYRLPTEKEWMTYAQCGDGREYPWGNDWPPPSGEAGNYHGQEGAGSWPQIVGYDDGFPVTAPVDLLWCNPWGLHGVGGNVWEACASDGAGRLFGAWRGAAWYISDQDWLRCSYRHSVDSSERSHRFGFRLVLSR